MSTYQKDLRENIGPGPYPYIASELEANARDSGEWVRCFESNIDVSRDASDTLLVRPEACLDPSHRHRSEGF